MAAMEGKIELVTLPSSNHVCLLPYQVPQVNKILQKLAFDPLHSLTIVDGTSHIGCDSLNFANTFPNARIVAVDNDRAALECLKINVKNAGKAENFEIVEGDFERWIEGCNVRADLYYLDPPWGDNYHSLKESSLSLGGRSIGEIVKRIFDLGLSNKVLLKVPRNFAYPQFKRDVTSGTGHKTELSYIYKNGRHPQIAYGLVIITKSVTQEIVEELDQSRQESYYLY